MLRIEHLTKNYKSFSLDCTMEVKPGCVTGLIGQNGAGKTTTMKLILGLLASDSGEISVNGRKVRYGSTAANRMVGYLPDVPEFYPYMDYRHDGKGKQGTQ